MIQYQIIDLQSNDINELETTILEWKLNNMVTYMDSIKVINNNLITFFVEINDIIYNFSLINNNKWNLSISDYIDIENETNVKVLDMVDIINTNYNYKLENNNIIYLLDLIEKHIDSYEFNDESSSSSSETEKEIYDEYDIDNIDIFDQKNETDIFIDDNIDIFDQKNETDIFIDDNKTYLSSINISRKIIDNDMSKMMDEIDKYNLSDDPFNDLNQDDLNQDCDLKIENTLEEVNDDFEQDIFKKFIENIEIDDDQIDYNLLKENALNKINDITGTNKLFQPNLIIQLIINEIKQIRLMENIKLDFSDNNIYNFKVIYTSEILNSDIIFNINLNTIEYPCTPPIIHLIQPIMTIDFNYYINTMDYFKLDNWNPINSIHHTLFEICKLIDKYGKIGESKTSYSEFSILLSNLSLISKITHKLENIDFQINYVKCNNETINKSHWKSGTGYGSSSSQKWDIKKYLESDEYKLNKLTEITKSINKCMENEISIDEINNSCLIEYIVTSLTDSFDLTIIETNKLYIDELIKLYNNVLSINPNYYNKYIHKFKDQISSLELIYEFNKSNEIINILLEMFKKLTENHITESIDIISNNIYVDTLKPLLFSLYPNLENINSLNMSSKIVNNIRLAKEISVLSKSLPINYESSIFVRVDEKNIQSMQVLIIPTHGTPYSNGCFLFHLYVPDTYPAGPPLVKIVTTGSGTVRFNPNLYNNGKVCLSLLGTWQGDASESWNPKTSSILQVLISIQSLIFIEQPYFNEPGYEQSINSETGRKNSENYNKNIQYNTIVYAMIDMIKNPPLTFKDVIINHFKLKKDHILKETRDWTGNDSINFLKKYDELKNLLDSL
jgi:ubiquitin-protein ligase